METHDTVLNAITEGYEGQEVPYEVPVTAYPTTNGVIIVNAPGAGVSGYRNLVGVVAESDLVGDGMVAVPRLVLHRVLFAETEESHLSCPFRQSGDPRRRLVLYAATYCRYAHYA